MTVIAMPAYCVINVYETERPWHCAGTLQECWAHLVEHYGKVRGDLVRKMGWAVVPVRRARIL